MTRLAKMSREEEDVTIRLHYITPRQAKKHEITRNIFKIGKHQSSLHFRLLRQLADMPRQDALASREHRGISTCNKVILHKKGHVIPPDLSGGIQFFSDKDRKV